MGHSWCRVIALLLPHQSGSSMGSATSSFTPPPHGLVSSAQGQPWFSSCGILDQISGKDVDVRVFNEARFLPPFLWSSVEGLSSKLHCWCICACSCTLIILSLTWLSSLTSDLPQIFQHTSSVLDSCWLPSSLSLSYSCSVTVGLPLFVRAQPCQFCCLSSQFSFPSGE